MRVHPWVVYTCIVFYTGLCPKDNVGRSYYSGPCMFVVVYIPSSLSTQRLKVEGYTVLECNVYQRPCVRARVCMSSIKRKRGRKRGAFRGAMTVEKTVFVYYFSTRADIVQYIHNMYTCTLPTVLYR